MPVLIKATARPPFRDVKRRFTKATRDLEENKRTMMRGLGQRYVVLARDEAPEKIGKFKKGIRFRTFARGDRFGFIVTSPRPLGKWIIEGTKPHEIVPKGPGYPLKFFWEKLGKVVYTYHVNHPGTKPNPFIQRAVDRWLPESRRALNRISRDWAIHVAR